MAFGMIFARRDIFKPQIGHAHILVDRFGVGGGGGQSLGFNR